MELSMTTPQQPELPVLLPCPFCACDCTGSGPTPHKDDCWFKVDRDWRKAIADDLDFSLTQDVIDAWNRRAQAAVLADRERRVPLTEDRIRDGFRANDEHWPFKGMTAWQVWNRAVAWVERVHRSSNTSAAEDRKP